MSRKLKIVLFGGFALLALLVSAVLTFPYDVLGRRIEAEVARALPGTTLVIGEIGPALPIGLRVARVTLHRGTGPENRVEIDRLRVKPSLLKLLIFRPTLAFDLRAFSGEAAGSVSVSSGQANLNLDLKNLQIEQIAMLKAASGIDLSGAVNGRIQLNLNPTGQPTDGVIEATIDSARLEGGKVMGFSIPSIDLGSPEVNIPIVDGEATIERLATSSPDGSLDITGTVSLRPVLAQSRVKGTLSLQLEDAFLNRNPTLKGLMGFAGSLKQPDGSIQVPLDGPLNRPARVPGLGF